MKKHLILLVPIVLLAALTATAISHYKNNQHKAIVAQTAYIDVEAVMLKAEQAKNTKVTQAYSLLYVECTKGAAAHDALPKSIQAKVPHPTCGPALAQ